MRDFDKKNEIPKVKIPKFATGGICNDAMFPTFDMFPEIDEIVKDIRERQDNAMAMEFTKCIGELLRKNGVVPKLTEYTAEFDRGNTFECRYGVSIDELDFSEHDKVFEGKIAELKQRIAELESKETETCEKEPKISDSAPSREWYENRHQSDCIEINRLNTTIDVLIHKVEYLRQFAGLE